MAFCFFSAALTQNPQTFLTETPQSLVCQKTYFIKCYKSGGVCKALCLSVVVSRVCT